MQIKIMRHHRRTQDTNAYVEHLLIQDNTRARHEPESDPEDAGPREKQFDRETCPDGYDERDDQRLDIAETFVLKIKYSEHVEGGNDTSPDQRNAKEELQ